MCDSQRFGETDLSAAGLGEMEREWLHLVRLHCMSYEHNHAEGWDAAISVAEARYGAEDGPGIASRVAVLIRAMRAERCSGFGYRSAICPSCRERITEDEAELLQLMQAGYLGEPLAIAEAASVLARRPAAPALTAAAARFGAALAAAVGHEPQRRSPPSLRLH